MTKEIKTLKIGNKRLKNNLFLAPMLGYTNWAFRELIQKNTEISVFTEMIPINALSKDSNYCKDIIKRGDLEKNVFYQFFGNDEEKLVKSIQNILDLGIKIDFINLNCGCPAGDIVSQGAGSALLKRQSKINTMIEYSKKNFDIPFTIKIRSGYDIQKHLNYNELEDSGLDALFVHPRTKKQQYSGKIDLNFLKETKEQTNIPVIGNGDIINIEDIKKMYDYTNCDGYMLGRVVLTNPFIFDEILNSNYYNFSNKIHFLEEYFLLLQKDNNNSAFQNAKTLALFLVREIRNASKVREEISKTKTFFEIKEIIKKIK
jgi:nifR3 family TIM-barrel protein